MRAVMTAAEDVLKLEAQQQQQQISNSTIARQCEQMDKGIARRPELICVYVAIVADAIVQYVIAPYAVSWVRDTFQVDNVGLYSGLLVGSTACATALTSPFFGWLSDIIGRRALLAGGLFSAGVLTLIGGLSQQYWLCFAMRFLAGLLDASQTVAFAAIGDVTTGQYRTVAFGLAKAASQVARILTSIIGGFTYDLKPDPIFKHVPSYDTVLLSQLIAFGSCLFAVILIVLFYREGPEFNRVTKRIKHAQRIQQQQQQQQQEQMFELQQLQQLESLQVDTSLSGEAAAATEDVTNSPPTLELRPSSSVSPPSGPPRFFPLESSSPSLPMPLLSEEPTLYQLFKSHVFSTVVPATATENDGLPPLLPIGSVSSSFDGHRTFWEGVRDVLSKPLLVRLILVYSLIAFLNGGLMLSIMLLAQAKAGFDMRPKDASIIMLLFGSYAIFFNTVLFKHVVARLGPKRANGWGLLMTAFGLLGLPFTSMFVRDHTVWMWICITLAVIVFASGYMCGNAIIASLISIHASAEMQGITQGMALFASQILTGLGPMAFGYIANAMQDAGTPIISYVCLTLGYTTAFLSLHWVPRHVLEKGEEEEEE